MNPESIGRCLEEGVRTGVFPGAAATVLEGGEVAFEGAAGWLDEPAGRPVTHDTIYDLASLTKPLVTAACVLRLAAAGILAIDQPVVRWVPEFGAGDERRSRVTVDDLLRHRSGLPAWRPYFAGCPPVATAETRASVAARAAAEPLEREPRAQVVYSDVGYLLLGLLLERAAQSRLDVLAEREVLSPLALRDCGFADLVDGRWRPPADRTAPTGVCLWRRTVVRGVVQDENAFAMGGIAGHAGLFGTARAVARIGQAWLEAWSGRGSWLEPELVRAAWTAPPGGTTWVAGWDTPTPGCSSAGTRVSQRAVGHLGFTGPSLWIDLDREVVVAVACNRVHPDRHNEAIRRWRPVFHDAVFGAAGE